MKIKDIYQVTHLISIVPIIKKLLMVLTVISIIELFIIFDLNANLGVNIASALLIFFIIINLTTIMIGCLFIKSLKEKIEEYGFNFRDSTFLTKQVQGEIVTPVTSNYSRDTKSYPAMKANLERFESFVVLLNEMEMAIIFIKEPREVQMRLSDETLDRIARDLAEITGLRNSKYEIKSIRTLRGLKHFQVQKLSR